MIILNAQASRGRVFGGNGEPLQDPWPTDGYRLCPRQSDQDLFYCLEKTNWVGGKIIASVRWWKRQSDDLHRGPEFTKGTFAFRGSGIHFYFLGGNTPTKKTTHFICEVPWKKLLRKKPEGPFSFVGEAQVRTAFLAGLDYVLKETNYKHDTLLQQAEALKQEIDRNQLVWEGM